MSEDYHFDETTGEWLPPGTAALAGDAGSAVHVRDAVGNPLATGDQVTLIKDLVVKGAGQTLKRGTLIKAITIPDPGEGRDPQEIDCRFAGIKGLVLRAEFVRKR